MDQKIDRILQYIHKQRNYDFLGNHPQMLQRRINKRVYAVKAKSFEDYYDYLESNHQEMDELVNAFTINVSGFFRDPLTFEYLRNVISGIIQEKLRNSNHNLRIWSAGCSTGEEPYTVAIMLSEILEKHLKTEISIDIIGTDIDTTALLGAKTGQYHKEMLKDTRFGLIPKYFTLKENRYCISGKIKKMVSFSKYDLLDKKSFVPPESVFGDFDIVLCRNVLIYFNQEYQKIIFDKLYRSIHKNGYLVLGESEIPIEQYKNKFKRKNTCCKIYQKR